MLRESVADEIQPREAVQVAKGIWERSEPVLAEIEANNHGQRAKVARERAQVVVAQVHHSDVCFGKVGGRHVVKLGHGQVKLLSFHMLLIDGGPQRFFSSSFGFGLLIQPFLLLLLLLLLLAFVSTSLPHLVVAFVPQWYFPKRKAVTHN